MKLSALFLVFFAISIFTSCRRTEHAVCSATDLRMVATGFSSADFDSAMVIRYKQDNTFDLPIDTIPVSFYEFDVSDTFEVSLEDTDAIGKQAIATSFVDGYPSGFLPGYDYKIILPAIAKSYAIAHITQSGVKSHDFTYTLVLVAHEPQKCYDNVVTCTINNNPYSSPYNINTPENTLYMPK